MNPYPITTSVGTSSRRRRERTDEGVDLSARGSVRRYAPPL